jgi:septum formation protein
MPIPPFILASASPARRQLLQNAGIPAIAMPSHFDEDQIQSSDPAELVEVLARSKATAVAQYVENSLILGCDSVLALHGQIHGKPDSVAEAIARWQQMRGQVGQLYTGHVLIDQTQHKIVVRHRVTQVFFATLSDRQIAAYVASGEPMNCAGCFALEGRGSLFIEKLEGCHSNVIGLSMPLLREMLGDFGYDVADFWQFMQE